MLRYGLFFFLALGGCSSTDPAGLEPTSESSISQAGEMLVTPEIFQERILGNTIVGRSTEFRELGPIDFQIVHLADGTVKDRLVFVRTQKVDRAVGRWWNENGHGCRQMTKRRKGEVTCSQLYIRPDGTLRTVPVTANTSAVEAKVVQGDLIQ